MDCFFYDGAKAIFQLALAILQANKTALLNCSEEGDAITVLANYLSKIENSDRKIEVRLCFFFLLKMKLLIN